MPASRRRPLDLAVAALAASTVVAFAAGSSSVADVTRVGRDARWVLLVFLLFAAGARVAVTRRFLVPPVPALAAAAFVGLALVSSAWSVSPRVSAERAVSLGILFAAAILLAAAEVEPRLLVAGLVAGSALVAFAGLLVLAFDHGAAVQAASYESPARLRGLGEDPNTAALLFGVAAGPAAGLALGARRPAGRLGWAAVFALLLGSIVASGSRGALFGAGIGAAVVLLVARGPRRAAAGVAVVAVAVAGCLALQNVPKAHATASSPAAAAAAAAAAAHGPRPAHGYRNAEVEYPLDADVGGPLPGGGQPTLTRGFFGGSGRLDAWTGAVHQILQRPVVGFGFGTESRVFVDRYYYFVGGTPEDSYLGVSLQLGVVGLALLLTLFGAVALPLRGAVGNEVAALCAGAVASGLALAFVQSYVYSVGNVASATLWICAFLVPVVARAA